MKKYVKPYFLVVCNNALLLLFFDMLNDLKYWGVIPTIFIGFGWLLTFSMLVVCARYAKPPHNIDQSLESDQILPTECTSDDKAKSLMDQKRENDSWIENCAIYANTGMQHNISIQHKKARKDIQPMDREKVKKMICEAIDHIPDCADIVDAYVEHSFGDSEAWIKVHVKVNEETDENITKFHNIAHEAFATELGFFS